VSVEFRRRPKFVFGEEGEHVVADILMHRGNVVLPMYQFHNHDRAPSVFWVMDEDILSRPLPDLLVWCGGDRPIFAEVKRKNRWVHWDGRRETGFNQRLYNAYTEIEQRTGCPVWVFFLHERMAPTGLYVAPLAKLAPTLRPWDGRNEKTGAVVERQPIAMFDSAVLTRLCDAPAVFSHAEQAALRKARG
jgi:hypothetical protein